MSGAVLLCALRTRQKTAKSRLVYCKSGVARGGRREMAPTQPQSPEPASVGPAVVYSCTPTRDPSRIRIQTKVPYGGAVQFPVFILAARQLPLRRYCNL